MSDVPEAALRARQMYLDGVSLDVIMKETGFRSWALYCWLDGGPERNGVRPLPALPRRIVRNRKVTAGDRLSLIGRLVRSSERQIAEIERRAGFESENGDKDARTLALIARTLRELTAVDALNREMTRRKKAPQAHDTDDGKERTVPRNVDDLRRSLARKLEAIIAERDSELPGEAD
jgi:hypothetical protein